MHTSHQVEEMYHLLKEDDANVRSAVADFIQVNCESSTLNSVHARTRHQKPYTKPSTIFRGTKPKPRYKPEP